MKFAIDKKELFVVLKIEENKLNSANAADLKTELVLLNNGGFRNIVLDLSSIAFVDSSGLSAILVCNRLCNNSGGNLVLVGVNPNVIQLIKISQLDSILDIIPTVQEAADFIKMEELTRQISEEE